MPRCSGPWVHEDIRTRKLHLIRVRAPRDYPNTSKTCSPAKAHGVAREDPLVVRRTSSRYNIHRKIAAAMALLPRARIIVFGIARLPGDTLCLTFVAENQKTSTSRRLFLRCVRNRGRRLTMPYPPCHPQTTRSMRCCRPREYRRRNRIPNSK